MKLAITLLAILIALAVVVEILMPGHGGRPPGFFALFGLGSVLGLVLVAKGVLGPIVSRKEEAQDR